MIASMLLSTISIESRTRSTVCCRLITPARARGAAPKTEEARALPPRGWSPSWRYQSTKPRIPACTISPTQDRSSALSSGNHGISVSMRAIAVVLSAPVELCRARVARARDAGEGGRVTHRQ